MTDLIDLHVHSTCSDGTLSPTELVDLAIKKNLRAFALTDHDTIEGINEAMNAVKERGSRLEIIPGIEFSTSYCGRDIHILGLGIQHNNVHFQERLFQFQDSRDLRNDKMMAKLCEEGLYITREMMQERFDDTIWTRAHFARILLELGYISNLNDAFEKYIGDDGPCFIPREKVTPFQAIRLIHEGGGKAVLAHPLLYNLSSNELDLLVSELAKCGLDGMEVIYAMNRHGDEQRMRLLAKKYHLKQSGGSDFHGLNKPNIQLGSGKGNVNIPYQVWKNLKE